MGVNWGDMAKTLFEGATWEESFSIWKLSNVLGWSVSSVGGWYMSNYGLIKTQLMLGLERKINYAYKYEWYLTAPTKVLVEGEKKIDLKELRDIRPESNQLTLSWCLSASKSKIEAFETELKAAKKADTVAGEDSKTCGSHSLTATTGSTENIPLGSKTIQAPTGSITMESPMISLTGATGNSFALAMGGAVTMTGTVINIG